jgi:glycosyltransferase involved in cell wall biosynthesis
MVGPTLPDPSVVDANQDDATRVDGTRATGAEHLDGSRPRLLAVSTIALEHRRNGFSLRIENLLRELVRHWRVVLVAPPGGVETELLPALEAYRPVTLNGEWRTMPAQFDTVPLRQAVACVRAEFPPDAALLWAGAEFLAFGEPAFPPVVADRIDSTALIHWRDVWQGSPLDRLRAVAEVVVCTRYERQAVRAMDATVVVGDDDARALRRIGGRNAVQVVPNGVELAGPPHPGDEASVPAVVFSGTLAYGPNVDAVRYFASAVWPRIRREVPEARFRIVGRFAVPEVLALDGDDGIEVLGEVADMGAILREAWVAVAPMTSGAGIKNKILEAWAQGTPVVMTLLAANGLHLDEHAAGLVADDPGTFACRVVGLLRRPEERLRLGRAGYELAARRHSWADAARRISELLHAARGQRGAARR